MPRARPAVTTSSRSGAAARPSCRSSSAWCSASTTARSTSPCRSTRKWSVTSSASSRRPGPSMAIRATRKPRRLEDYVMSKPKRERSLPDNEAKAVARMLRVSPQKLNLVAQLIRGRKASAALADLQFSRKRIAVDVKKCLESAIANAENNHDLDVDELVVAQAFVGNGIVMKRFAPRGRGRSGRVFTPFSQLTIIVRQVEAEAAA